MEVSGDDLQQALTGLGVLGAAMAAILRVLRSDRDWQSLISGYRQQVADLSEQIVELKEEIAELKRELEAERKRNEE